MSPNRILLILLLVAIVAVFAYLILAPVISKVTNKPSIGDVAVQAIQTQISQATSTAGTPPASAAEMAATIAAIPINAAATQQAENRAREQSIATQDARAASTQAAQVLNATATGEYWKNVYWSATSTSAYEQTQTAYPPMATAYSQTQTALPLYATAEAGRIQAQETVVAGQAMGVENAVRTNQWAGPIGKVVEFLAIIAALGLLWLAIREMKRVRRLTPDGKINLVEDKQGEFHQTSADLMPTSSMKIGVDGVVIEADADYQEKITSQAQQVRAIEAAASAQSPQQAFNAANMIMNGNAPRYVLDEPPTAFLPAEIEKDLDKEWEEAHG